MQSRLTLLASRGGRGAAPHRRTFLFLQDSQRKTGICTSRTTRTTATKTAVHPSLSHVRSFHRASPPHLLAPPSSALAAASYVDDNDDYEYDMRQLERDIERFSVSSFSQVLPEEIFYKPEDIAPDGRKKYAGSEDRLSQELGMDSIWDSSTLEEGSEDEDEFLVEEEDYFQDRQRPQRPTDNTTIPNDNVTSRPRDGKKSALEILRNFNVDDQPPSTSDLEEYQLWLECAAQREAVLKYQKALDSARNRKDYDSMSFMQKHLVQWYQSLRDVIQARQQEYLSNQDTRTAKNVYGPLLCSLSPEKMAVIASHEAIAHALSKGGINGRNGVPLVSMARAIGEAVETEVITQHRLRERFRSPNSKSNASEMDEDGESSDTPEEPSHNGGDDQSTAVHGTADKWVFSAGHLKQFMEILKQGDPKFKKTKQSLKLKLRKAQQAANSSESWSNDGLVHLGVVLLSMLFETAVVRQPDGVDQPAFALEKRWTKKFKTMSFVMLNEQVSKLFLEDEFVSLAATTTRHTPMILPPTDWVSPDEGGYRWLKVDLMRCHGSHTQQEVLKHANLTDVYDGLNVLGRTAWKVNQEILDVGQYCWKNNIPIGDIPSRDDFAVLDEPTRPERIAPEVFADKESSEYKAAIAANKTYREGIYRSRKNYQKNMDLRSLRCSTILKLNQAEKFKQFERIYFPYNLDFRGRAYPIPPHFSNVGSDLCRGMLTFADAKPLGKRGLYWLKVHLANFAGKDKMSFDDRAKYVDDNMENVRASAKDAFTENPWWKTLDDPFQGLATCYEIIRAIDSGDPESYLCSLPVHMDGSCNGLQHYAALGRDTPGGKAVNLLEGDGPQDVYVGVMHEVIRRVAEEAESVLPFDTSDMDQLSRKQKLAVKNNLAAKLVNGLIDRGVVKRTVMTSVYGVTYVGAREQIQQKVEEKLVEQGYDVDEMQREVFNAAGYLATLTIQAMGDLCQGAQKTKNWLTECARLITRHGHPVAWISPIGVPAIQPYRLTRARNVVTAMQTVTVAETSDDLPVNKTRQCTAFSPNYVHSLDSSHMLLTALEMDRRGLTFSAVHDSFWTHACDVDELNGALRDCFVDLYSRPVLKELKESWELRYPEIEFPELPELGDLDLNAVKSATYFFQ